MIPISVLCIGYLLSGLSATASQGHYPCGSQLCLNETSGQWAEQGVVFQPGNIPAINRTLPFQWCILCGFHYMTNLRGIF